MSIKDTIVANTADMQTAIDILSQVESEKTMVTIDGEPYEGELELVSNIADIIFSTLPYNFYSGAAVVYNDEIHILGGTVGCTSHYKWDGVSWVSVSTLPYDFYAAPAVVYNDEIHIFGSSASGNYTNHYKWDGAKWTSVSTLPYNSYSKGYSAAVYENEIHIIYMYGENGTNRGHYKWDGTSWISVDTLYSVTCSSGKIHPILVVCNNKLYSLIWHNPYSSFKVFSGTGWGNANGSNALSHSCYYGDAVACDDEIHLMGGNANSTTNCVNHYKWRNSTDGWIEDYGLPYDFYNGEAVVHKGKIHILGSSGSEHQLKHYAVVAPVYISN